MGNNKFISNTKTATGAKVSTITKILLSVIIIASTVALFAIVGGFAVKNITKNYSATQNLNTDDLNNKIIGEEVPGLTRDEQYQNLANLANLTKEEIKNCVESNGANCPGEKDIVEISCLCDARCAGDFHYYHCANNQCNSHAPCEAHCDYNFTVHGTCKDRVLITINKHEWIL